MVTAQGGRLGDGNGIGGGLQGAGREDSLSEGVTVAGPRAPHGVAEMVAAWVEGGLDEGTPRW